MGLAAMVSVLDHLHRAFYRRVLLTLREQGTEFAVGGAYGLRFHTGIARETKDLDIFVRRQDIDHALSLLREAGYRTEITHPHWLGKVYAGDEFVDIIFSSGNGIAAVDDALFAHALAGSLFDVPVLWCPVEEIIWSKAYVMERERYDGADVAHLVHVCGTRIDWKRLMARFGKHWRLLLSHLLLFGFIYPADRSSVPAWVLLELTQRHLLEISANAKRERVCAGTLLSREQFLVDVHDWGYTDARLASGSMSKGEIARWTQHIRGKKPTYEPRSGG